MTIVVDTDRSRVVEDQARLTELRAGVQGDREQLEKTRQELDDARRRLEKALKGGDPAADTAQLERTITALETRLGAPSSTAASRAELEAAFRAHELRVAAIVAAEVQRGLQGLPSASVGSDRPSAASAGLSPAARDLSDARTILDGTSARLKVRGLEAADLKGGATLLAQVRQAIADKSAEALPLAQSLQALEAATVPDAALARARYDRVNGRIRQLGLGDAALKAPRAHLVAATTAIRAGDYQGALLEMAEAERLATKP